MCIRVDWIWRQQVAVWVLIAMLAGLAGGALSPKKVWTEEPGSPAVPGQAQEPLGKRLVEGLGCVVCHTLEGHTTTVTQEAPDLRYEGDKVRPEWLFGFLKQPHSLRPWLNGRMPNFRLSEEEVQAIADYLMTLTYPGLSDGVVKEEKALSPLERFQAGKLFEKTYGCIACHQAKNRRGELVGGRSGPNLSEVGKRLQGDFIYSFIRAPRTFEPQGKMVVFGNFLPDKEPRALAAYLSTLKGDR